MGLQIKAERFFNKPISVRFLIVWPIRRTLSTLSRWKRGSRWLLSAVCLLLFPSHSALLYEWFPHWEPWDVQLQPGGGWLLYSHWRQAGEGLQPANGGCAVGFRDLLPPLVSVCPLLPFIHSVPCFKSCSSLIVVHLRPYLTQRETSCCLIKHILVFTFDYAFWVWQTFLHLLWQIKSNLFLHIATLFLILLIRVLNLLSKLFLGSCTITYLDKFTVFIV